MPGVPGSWPVPVDRYEPPAPPTTQSRQLLFLAAGLSFVGFLIPSTAPFLLVVSGLLGMRTPGIARQFGRWALGLGIAVLGLQLITSTLGTSSWFPALLSLVATFGFALAALRNTSS